MRHYQANIWQLVGGVALGWLPPWNSLERTHCRPCSQPRSHVWQWVQHRGGDISLTPAFSSTCGPGDGVKVVIPSSWGGSMRFSRRSCRRWEIRWKLKWEKRLGCIWWGLLRRAPRTLYPEAGLCKPLQASGGKYEVAATLGASNKRCWNLGGWSVRGRIHY